MPLQITKLISFLEMHLVVVGDVNAKKKVKNWLKNFWLWAKGIAGYTILTLKAVQQTQIDFVEHAKRCSV
jgi:hypothetical protein